MDCSKNCRCMSNAISWEGMLNFPEGIVAGLLLRHREQFEVIPAKSLIDFDTNGSSWYSCGGKHLYVVLG